MITRNFSLLFILFFSFNYAQSQADVVIGNWLSTDNAVAVEVYKSDGEYQAKVIWFDEKLGSGKPMNSRIDSENPNPKLRNRKIIGMEILHGLTYNQKQNTWENGRIYDATSGRTWDSSVKMNKDGTMNVRGYWKFKWIGKSMNFKKINQLTSKK